MYPEAKMIDAMKVWKLPSGKESMLSEICQSGDYFLEEKIDGYWYEYEKTENYSYLFSRNTSTTTGLLSEKGANVPHIMEALDCMPSNTILIGEIYYPGCTSKTVTTVMGCLPELAVKRQANNPIHYYIHDIIEYDGINLINLGAEDRYKILTGVWNRHNLSQYDFLKLALKITENLEEEISKILNSGGEGAVLKKKDYPYTPGKRPAWSTVKVKQMDSIDLVCTGLCPPTKEYTGKELDTWPYWESPDGELCDFIDAVPKGDLITEGYVPITKYYYNGWKSAIKIGAYDNDNNLVDLGTVGSGITDDMKRLMTEFPGNFVGHVVALDCMSINRKDHTLRHPVFKCMRDDKDAKDCLIDEIFK